MDASKCHDVSWAVSILLGRKGALSQGSLPQPYKSPRLTANLWAAAGSGTTPWKTWGHQSLSVRGTLWVSFLGHMTYDLKEIDGTTGGSPVVLGVKAGVCQPLFS